MSNSAFVCRKSRFLSTIKCFNLPENQSHGQKSWAFIEKKLMTSQLAIVTMIFFVTMSRPCVRYCVILLRDANDR